MDARERTAALKREDVPVDRIDRHPSNPNRMSQREFDLLVQNIEEVGFVEPILVRKMGERYRLIGGEHRWEAARYLGFESVPAVVIDDPSFADELEEFQLVRLNAIHGKIDPQRFIVLYQRYAGKYGAGQLQELFGFADESEFAALLRQTKESLPKELKKKFDEASKELKTIDDLAALLNRLFSEFGHTLPYNLMYLDYGKQKSLWIRCTPGQWKTASLLADWCVGNQSKMDEVVHELFCAKVQELGLK